MNSLLPHPLLYQIHTRPWLQSIAYGLGRPATLDDIPDTDLDAWQQAGFDWIYLLGVWQTGEYGRQAALNEPWLRDRARVLLADFNESDITSSCFALQSYRVDASLGDEATLARFRARLHACGLRLMLDFVPNHTAVDHPWATSHPEYYIQGSDQDLEQSPLFYIRLETEAGPKILAHGRDPYFPAWRDTLQLNYSRSELQQAMLEELQQVALQCDGVRCDTAMLVLPGVIERIWGLQAEPFWPQAIHHIRQKNPDFVFLAEVYWGLEWTLQQDGFDYTYDKGLYDRLRNLHARPVREHLMVDVGYQNRLARFIENHDEHRAASEFTDSIHPAAAVVAFLNPGMRFFHQGQLEGYRERVPIQLRRAPREEPNPLIRRLYGDLLSILRQPALRTGLWRLLDPLPTHIGDAGWEDIIAWVWEAEKMPGVLAVVNYSPQPGTCRLRLPAGTIEGLDDLLGDGRLEFNPQTASQVELMVELPPWGVRVARLVPKKSLD